MRPRSCPFRSISRGCSCGWICSIPPTWTRLIPASKPRAAEVLPHYEAVFTETNNPLYAWAAYRHARAWRLDVPEWVLAYLNTAAEKLLGMARDESDQRSELDALIAEAMGMKRIGRGTVFSEFRGELYAAQIEIAVQVALRLRAGVKLINAWDDIAKEFGGKPRMVRDVWESTST